MRSHRSARLNTRLRAAVMASMLLGVVACGSSDPHGAALHHARGASPTLATTPTTTTLAHSPAASSVPASTIPPTIGTAAPPATTSSSAADPPSANTVPSLVDRLV